MLVAEGHRFECQNRFARLVHWFDRVLEPVRGNDCAEVTIGAHNYPYSISDSDPADSSDKGVSLDARCADANRVRVNSPSRMANIDVVAALLDIFAGKSAHRNVEIGSITVERIETNSRVVVAESVEIEGTRPVGGVIDAASVVFERVRTGGRVLGTGFVEIERLVTTGHVGATGCV